MVIYPFDGNLVWNVTILDIWNFIKNAFGWGCPDKNFGIL